MSNRNRRNKNAPTDLSIIQWNARSLLNTRLEEFREYLHNFNPMIVLLSETFWKENKAPSFKCYSTVRNDRTERAGGGVAILVHKSVYFSNIILPTTPTIETIGISIASKNGPIDIVSAYCPLGNCSDEELNSIFESLQNDFIVGGDFNGHHELWEKDCSHTNRSGNAIATALSDLPDIALLTPPDIGTRTNINTGGESTIDLTFSSSALSIDAEVFVGKYLGSDHLPVHVSIKISPSQAESRAPRWIFDDKKWTDWNKLLSNTLAAAKFSDISDPQSAYDVFFDGLMTANRDSFRVSSSNPKTQKEPRRPYISEACLEQIEKAHDARTNWKNHLGTPGLREEWRRAESKKKRMVRRAKTKSWQKYVSNFNPKEPQAKVWNHMRQMMGRGAGPSVDNTVIKSETGSPITDPAEKSEIFLKTYDLSSNKGPEYTDIPPEVSESIQSEEANPLNSPIIQSEIDAALSNLKNCATGADMIHNKMLSSLNVENRGHLLHLFKVIQENNYVHPSWKEAIVIPVIKPNKPKDAASSYRPISLTSCLCKLYEKILNNRLNWFLESKNLLPGFQSGFRKRRSTTDNLVDLEQRIRRGFNSKKGKKTYALFLDISKAYDVVWIPGLLKKLAKLGISGNILGWLKNFLTDRSFCVRIGNVLSESRSIKTGVPQGAILSPLLFNIMLSDFPGPSRGVKVLLYADDVEADVSADSCDEAEGLLQPFLDKISAWAKKWKFIFAADKSLIVVFSRSHEPPDAPMLFLMGRRIPSSEKVKFLGLMFDRKLLWTDQVDNVVAKCKRARNIFAVIAKQKYGPSTPALVIMYKALVRSIVDYGLIIYGGTCDSNITKIDRSLRATLRLILGAPRSTPVSVLYAELGLEPTSDRRTWLTARYIFQLDTKPLNAAYHSNYYIVNNNSSKWKPRSTPCLVNTTRQLREIGFEIFETVPDFIAPVKCPPPWKKTASTLFFPMPKKEAAQQQQLARSLFREWQDGIPENALLLYTDGSYNEEKDTTASAVYAPQDHYEAAWSLSKGSSVFSSELLAIGKALEHVYAKDNPPPEIYILSDSKAAISAITSLKLIFNPHCLSILNNIECLQAVGSRVTLVWIPSHVGIVGNEKADSLAANESKFPSLNKIPNLLTPDENISLFKKNWNLKTLQQLKNCCSKETVLFRESLGIADWQFSKIRKASVALHKLRSGHNRLGVFQNRIDEEHDPTCRFGCADLENAAHLLLWCQQFNEARHKVQEFCRQKEIPFDLPTVLGCSNNISHSLRFQLREKVAQFIVTTKLASLV